MDLVFREDDHHRPAAYLTIIVHLRGYLVRMRHGDFKHLETRRTGDFGEFHGERIQFLSDKATEIVAKADGNPLARRRSSPESRAVISPWDVIQSVLWVYLLILAGAVARRTGLIPQEYDEAIMRVVYMVMIPCYILDKILGSDVLRDGMVVVTSIAMGFGLILTSIGISALIGKLIGLGKGTGMRTFALSAGSQNYGFTAAPVVESLWVTSTSTGALAVLFIHNIGVELALWSVGVMIMSGSKGVRWRHLCNGMVFGVVIGLTLVALNLDHLVTGTPRVAMKMLGAGAFPLGVFIIGCTIMSMIGAERPSIRILTAAMAARFVAIPLVFISAAKFLPLSTELRQVIVVQAAMPAAVTPIILAKLYNGRPAIAVHIVVLTTVLSMLTLPWIISFACWWIGLNPILK